MEVSKGNAIRRIVSKQRSCAGIAGGGRGEQRGEVLEAVEYLLQFCDNFIQDWSVCGVVVPHTLHHVDQFRAPLLLEFFRRRSLSLCADDVVNSMLIHTLPRIFWVWQMPLEHFPIDHRTRKDVDLEIVFRLGVPQLWRLPVDGPDQAPDH